MVKVNTFLYLAQRGLLTSIRTGMLEDLACIASCIYTSKSEIKRREMDEEYSRTKLDRKKVFLRILEEPLFGKPLNDTERDSFVFGMGVLNEINERETKAFGILDSNGFCRYVKIF